MNRVCFVKNEKSEYPDVMEMFSDNDVSKMICEGLHLLGLDDEHYGTDDWNPLKDYVKPGDNVLIKPNMVVHENVSGGGTDCLYTHPSLVVVMIKYVIKALLNKGTIVVGDAPIQDCIFDKLVKDSGYDKVIEHFQEMGIDIRLVDFRNVKTTNDGDDIRYVQEKKKNEGILVQLGSLSAFDGLTDDRQNRFRITNYDPREMSSHHMGHKHEYKVAREVLDADVIINMCKPKTHRKAGVTIALKNLVGINANKEYLPHHTLGSVEEGGDAYSDKDLYLARANSILDLRNELVNEGELGIARLANELYEGLKAHNKSEKYWEGSWYGNDTIWRTITDLNIILKYADKKGGIKDTPQRKMLIVGDMIVSGEKEGPLEPSPIPTGVVALGDDPILFDEAVCSLMGFDYKSIPSIAMPEKNRQKSMISSVEREPEIVSNNPDLNGKELNDIRDNLSLEFVPSMGWRECLGDRRLDKVAKIIRESGNEIYIFGAGGFGKLIAQDLIKEKVRIKAFVDNSPSKNGAEIMDGIKCISPNDMDVEVPVIIGVTDVYKTAIKNQLEQMGANVVRY